MQEIVQRVQAAFAARKYPGDDNIARCSYDKRNGGTYDGPCWECQEMTDFFRGKTWRDLTARDLRTNGASDSLFTVDAYCFYLPAYLTGALTNRRDLDDCIDHLTYRFGPKQEDTHGQERLSSILKALTDSELQAVVAYFRYANAIEKDFDGFCERSVGNVERELSKRPNSAMQPTAGAAADRER